MSQCNYLRYIRKSKTITTTRHHDDTFWSIFRTPKMTTVTTSCWKKSGISWWSVMSTLKPPTYWRNYSKPRMTSPCWDNSSSLILISTLRPQNSEWRHQSVKHVRVTAWWEIYEWCDHVMKMCMLYNSFDSRHDHLRMSDWHLLTSLNRYGDKLGAVRLESEVSDIIGSHHVTPINIIRKI